LADEALRQPRRPFERAWSDFEPTEAEWKLAEPVSTAEQCVLGKQAPDKGAEENTIRADFPSAPCAVWPQARKRRSRARAPRR
jgi:hypothetical protein